MINFESTSNLISSSGLEYRANKNTSQASREPPSNSAQSNYVALSTNDIDFATTQSKNDFFNTSASTIHAANKIMDDVANVVGKKQQEILQYEKIYPPFQNVDSERVERLMSIPAFKKQLDELMLVDNTDSLSEKVIANLSGSDISENFFDDVENIKLPNRTVENGLDIASTKVIESDHTVRRFSEELSSIISTLGTIQAGVNQSSDSLNSLFTAEEAKMGLNMLQNEEEARQKSEEVRQELATSQTSSIGHENARTLLENFE